MNEYSICFKCPSAYGQCWIPCSLVFGISASKHSMYEPQRPLSTTVVHNTSLSTNCSMSSAHERFVHELSKRCFLECPYMNLNFKLFLFFVKSTDLFSEKSYVNTFFFNFMARKNCMLTILSDWGPSTQIWVFAVWMYSFFFWFRSNVNKNVSSL